MTTIVNTPPQNNAGSSGGMGFLIGILILIFVGALIYVYGLPYAQQMMNKGVQVNIPKDINVQVQQTE